MKKQLLSGVCIFLFISTLQAHCERTPIYLDETQPIEQRIEDALSRMTLEEKIAMIHAQAKFFFSWCRSFRYSRNMVYRWATWYPSRSFMG